MPTRTRKVTTRSAKAEANRRNAQLSTGPRSAEGKAIVAQNAVRHGIWSSLPVLPHEDEHAWVAHYDGVLVSLNPANEAELAIVEQVAWALWRLRRVATYELAATALNRENVEALAPRSLHSNEVMAALAVLPDTPRLDKVRRYEAHLQRSISRCLDQLKVLRAMCRAPG